MNPTPPSPPSILLSSRTSGTEPIRYSGDAHLMTVAPTGAGKGRSVIIPSLLTYPGPVIVVDPKGENYAVTARKRRAMGQHVVKLDPFNVINDGPKDSFNPFDMFDYTRTSPNDDARMLAELVMLEKSSPRDPFWDNWASTVISGMAIYLATSPASEDPAKRSFGAMRDMIYNNDSVYGMAKLLDEQGSTMDKEAYQEIGAFLSISADNTRSGVLATVQQYLRLFGSPTVRKALELTTFDLEQIVKGGELTIYIIIPPNKLNSHRALFRLWVGSLLALVAHRTTLPPMNTLFLIDEAAQLGHLSLLQQAKTLLRGYGLQAWSFWQDISQIKKLYPTDWVTMVNNSAVLQLFGVRNHLMVKEFAEIAGLEKSAVQSIRPEQQILIVDGEPHVCRRPDYLHDKQFAGQWDPNPYYAQFRSR